MCTDITKEKAAVKFLEDDFNQAFGQLRHYDQQILTVSQFMTTVYSGVIALAVGGHQFTIEKKIDMKWAYVIFLVPSILFGFCFLATLIRNRVYFTRTCRYINEHRQFFLASKPLGFENISRMHIDPDQPRYFYPLSSHSFFIYIACLFNGILISLLFYFISPQQLTAVVFLGLLCAVVQVVASCAYLNSKEQKNGTK